MNGLSKDLDVDTRLQAWEKYFLSRASPLTACNNQQQSSNRILYFTMSNSLGLNRADVKFVPHYPTGATMQYYNQYSTADHYCALHVAYAE